MTDAITSHAGRDLLVRLGGLGGFLSMTLYLLINFVIKELPPESTAPLHELQSYLTRERGAWALAHGLRYVVFFSFAVFATGLHARIRSRRNDSAEAWSVLGLLGTAALIAIGHVTNSIENLVFFDHDIISNDPDSFWLLYTTTRFIFNAAPLLWGMIILGFSIAGRISGSVPMWLVAVGVVAGVTGLMNAFLIDAVLNGAWVSYLVAPVLPATLTWGIGVGILMMLRGEA